MKANMDINEVKENLIELLEQFEDNENVVRSMREFIKEYDGTKVESFAALMMKMVVLLMYIQRLEVKSGVFDKINLKHEDFAEALNKMTKEYEAINDGEMPVTPSVTTQV